jgi:hypothetical protein
LAIAVLLTLLLSASGAGKRGDAYGHQVWKTIRKSDGRAKHTSSMLGSSSTGVERRYAPAEATEVMGTITFEFPIHQPKEKIPI